jgi:tetratricopeptide (TPR) repeat protein
MPFLLLLLRTAFGLDSTDSLRHALNLFNSGKYQESFELVSQYVRENPNSPTGHKLLGMDEFMLGHPSEALAEVTLATKLAPRDPDALYYLGRLYFTADNAPAAREAFEKTIALDPSNVRAHDHLGQTHQALGMQPEAEKEFRRAVELQKDQPKKSEWPDYHLGALYLDEGRTADAIECLRHTLEINPSFPEAKVKLAVALSSKQPVPEAFELLQEALRADPRNAEAHYRLALLLTKAGNRGEARQHFELFEKYRKP